MPFLVLSAFLIALAYPMVGVGFVVWVLAAAQFVLLLREIRRGQVTGAGGFILMLFLFFGVLPIYLVIENGKWLFTAVFRIRPDLADITEAMWWGSAALPVFAVGAMLAPRLNWKSLSLRRAREAAWRAPLRSFSQLSALN